MKNLSNLTIRKNFKKVNSKDVHQMSYQIGNVVQSIDLIGKESMRLLNNIMNAINLKQIRNLNIGFKLSDGNYSVYRCHFKATDTYDSVEEFALDLVRKSARLSGMKLAKVHLFRTYRMIEQDGKLFSTSIFIH